MMIAAFACGTPPPDIERMVDNLFTEFTEPQTPGASVAISHDGEIVLAKGYGLADLPQHTPADAHTNYRIASVTKQFTAMAIMILKERGKLDYDDPIAKYFPDFPPIGATITIRHLLGHTSGLKDYEDLMPVDQSEQLKDRDVLALLQRERETYFPPGTQYRYSNSGYALLALIVERASGDNFATFLKKNIFAPLGMNDSVAYERGVSSVPHRAMGYRKSDSGWVDADQSLTSAVLGDGGIYTSVLDYFKWDQALNAIAQSAPRGQGRDNAPARPRLLVTPETLVEAFTSGRLADGALTGYGFGWRIETVDGLLRIHHNGETCGFNTAVRRVPERRLTVVVFTNRAGSCAHEIADTLLARLIETHEPKSPD
ncbi:MAG: beta-lactamase family protein [Phycisphaerales bacterium]|nr:beta-lactamase family protein [Phycisphaerales bacterium]